MAGGQQVEQAGQHAAVDDGLRSRGRQAPGSKVAREGQMVRLLPRLRARPGPNTIPSSQRCCPPAAPGQRGQRVERGRTTGPGRCWVLNTRGVVSRAQRAAGDPVPTCVCWSSPVTMLPTVRSAGTSTDGDWCLRRRASGGQRGSEVGGGLSWAQPPKPPNVPASSSPQALSSTARNPRPSNLYFLISCASTRLRFATPLAAPGPRPSPPAPLTAAAPRGGGTRRPG